MSADAGIAEVVCFEELPTASGHRFGVATLNAEAALNALSLPMVQALYPQLRAWAADAGIAGVVLQAAGDKAFCAGGDLRALYNSMRAEGETRNAYCRSFFEQEYRLDHLIHSYPKSLLCWGHGIVMGGGIGLMIGASHRVATPRTRLAMPEISVGLFPDVGGSWFLRRMPGRAGLFLALTGAPLNAADARYGGLADFVLDHERKGAVLAAIGAAAWSGEAGENHRRLTQLLDAQPAPATLPESKLRQHRDTIDALVGHDGLADIAARLRSLQTNDPWLSAAVTTFLQGSPTSAALSFALWQRVPRLSLADVFRLEYDVALGCATHPDFAEGIRALIVDKDRQPRWTPARPEEVSAEWIAAHFSTTAPHPLADLR